MNNPPFQGVANHLAGYGRYGDSQLVHMNPAEVQGIASLVPGGKLTTNPVTGQPEAFLPFLIPLISQFAPAAFTAAGGALAGSTGLMGAIGGGLTALGSNAALGSAVASGAIEAARTGDLKKGLMSGITSFGIGKALGGAKDIVAGVPEATATADAAKSAAMKASAGELAAEELSQLPASLAADEAAKEAAQMGITDIFRGEDGLMGGAKAVTKGLMSSEAMIPVAIGEGQRTQMEADEELERRNAMNEENRRKEYLRSLGIMDEAYGRMSQDYPGNMNTGGIVSLNPDDYMQRRDGFNSLGKTVHMNNGGRIRGGKVGNLDRSRAEAQTQDAVSALADRGNISSSGLQELVQRLAPDADLSEFMHDFGPGSAADRQANIRGSQVITPQELAQLGRPGFGPEIQYFRRPDEAAPTPPPGGENPGPGGPGKGRDAGSDQFMNDLLAGRNTPPPASTSPTSPAAPAADAQPIAATPSGSIEEVVADIQAPAVDPREMEGMYGRDGMPGRIDRRFDRSRQEAMPDITVAEDPMEEAIVPPIPDSVAEKAIVPPDPDVPFVGPEMMGEDIAGIAELLAQREGRPPRGMRFMLAGGDTNMSPPVDPSQMPVGPAQQSADPTQVLIEQTIMAVLGQLPEEQAEVVVNQFINEFGEEAFQMLRDQTLNAVVPGAQTEGMIEGEGGGMDDLVPGMIGNQQQVAVSPGEYIVPADVVSGLGDGSSDAGADKLDAMMDDVRVAKTGGTIQPGPINNRVIPV